MTMSEDDTNVPDARKRAWGAVYKPRYSGIATFMRQELREDPEDWDGIEIGMIGVPFDGAVTNRPGARHGPRALRDPSTARSWISRNFMPRLWLPASCL
jgi:guanidinopropionase